ncbi:hypothetical protein HKX48_006729 [Thoreauomyces humboldtii]|nr:hypothetical protein HKX48_006729 [Thoreauomyces humboldtii]
MYFPCQPEGNGSLPPPPTPRHLSVFPRAPYGTSIPDTLPGLRYPTNTELWTEPWAPLMNLVEHQPHHQPPPVPSARHIQQQPLQMQEHGDFLDWLMSSDAGGSTSEIASCLAPPFILCEPAPQPSVAPSTFEELANFLNDNHLRLVSEPLATPSISKPDVHRQPKNQWTSVLAPSRVDTSAPLMADSSQKLHPQLPQPLLFNAWTPDAVSVLTSAWESCNQTFLSTPTSSFSETPTSSYLSSPSPSFSSPPKSSTTHSNSNSTFRCSTCSRTFTRAYNLREHMQVHESVRERNHACDACPRRYFRIADLARHMKNRHGRKRDGGASRRVALAKAAAACAAAEAVAEGGPDHHMAFPPPTPAM